MPEYVKAQAEPDSSNRKRTKASEEQYAHAQMELLLTQLMRYVTKSLTPRSKPLGVLFIFFKKKSKTRSAFIQCMLMCAAILLAASHSCRYTPWCEPFLHPVSGDDVPEYHTIITKPMDLSTVQSKLATGQYAKDNKAEFEKDLRLIFNNCREFNYLPGNEYARLANLVEAKADNLLNGLRQAALSNPGFINYLPTLPRAPKVKAEPVAAAVAAGGAAAAVAAAVPVPTDAATAAAAVATPGATPAVPSPTPTAAVAAGSPSGGAATAPMEVIPASTPAASGAISNGTALSHNIKQEPQDAPAVAASNAATASPVIKREEGAAMLTATTAAAAAAAAVAATASAAPTSTTTTTTAAAATTTRPREEEDEDGVVDWRYERWNAVTKKRRVEIMIDRKKQHATPFGDRKALERDPESMAQFARKSFAPIGAVGGPADDRTPYFFPEHEDVMSALPPCPGPVQRHGACPPSSEPTAIPAGLADVGNAATNQVLRNLEWLARIRSVRKFVTETQNNSAREIKPLRGSVWDFGPSGSDGSGSHGGGGSAVVVGKTGGAGRSDQSPARHSSTSSTMSSMAGMMGGGHGGSSGGGSSVGAASGAGAARRMRPGAVASVGMPATLRKSTALMLAQAGYEDCNLGSLNVLVDATEKFCLTLGQRIRTLMDEAELKITEADAAHSAVQDMTRGGTDALCNYWKWDVLEYGAHLKAIDSNLEDKYGGLMISERSKVGISDNNVALVTGNFGYGLGDLGLDLLGLREQGLVPAKTVMPDALLVKELMPEVDFDRPYEHSKTGPVRAPRSAIKSEPKRLQYPVPETFTPIFGPQGQIALMQPLIHGKMKATRTGTASEDAPNAVAYDNAKETSKRKKADAESAAVAAARTAAAQQAHSAAMVQHMRAQNQAGAQMPMNLTVKIGNGGGHVLPP